MGVFAPLMRRAKRYIESAFNVDFPSRLVGARYLEIHDELHEGFAKGAPGTGKTWLAKRLAYALIGRKNRDRIRSIQFHPNLSYEDFVRGWRPAGNGRLVDSRRAILKCQTQLGLGMEPRRGGS